jgi:hypothetical protein
MMTMEAARSLWRERLCNCTSSSLDHYEDCPSITCVEEDQAFEAGWAYAVTEVLHRVDTSAS